MSNKNEKLPKAAITSEPVYHWIAEGVFFLFSFLFLGMYNGELLYKLQSSSLFLGNSIFAQESINQSAGLLVYASRFLIQLLFHPLLGGALLAAGLVGIERMIYILFAPKGTFAFLSFIPSLLIMLVQTSVGYALYDNFESSSIVSIELGTALSLALTLLFLLIDKEHRLWGMVANLLIAALLFFGIGIFALLPVFLFAIKTRPSNRKEFRIASVAGIALLLLLPFITDKYVYQEKYIMAMLSPISDAYFSNLYHLSLAVLLSILLIAVFKFKDTRFSNRIMVINVFMLALLCYGTYHYSFRDENYRTELTLQHQAENMEWKSMLNTVRKVKKPTQGIAAYRYIALLNTNQMDDLFNFPCRYDTIKSPYKMLTIEVYYPDLYFYSSQLNQAMMWNMEFWVNAGRNFGLLKRFAMFSLVKGEMNSARKYINLMKQTMFYSKWAYEHEKYIGHQDLLFHDYPILKLVNAMQIKEDISFGISNLPNTYIKYPSMDAANLQRRLMMDLYSKQTDQFMLDIQYLSDTYREKGSMPVCMQEVLALYALNKGDMTINRFPVRKDVIERVKNFVAAVQPYANDLDTGAEAMKDYEGDYCYFLVFSKVFPKEKKDKEEEKK
jgi:hypothetical protein